MAKNLINNNQKHYIIFAIFTMFAPVCEHCKYGDNSY